MLARFLLGRKDVGMERVEDVLSLPLGLQNSAAPQDLQMVGDVADFFPQFFRELADVLPPAAEGLHNPQPVFVPQRFQPVRAELGSEAG